MRVIVCDSYDQLSSVAADMIVRQINKKPDSVLGLATGSTPLGMYKELVRINKLKGVDFSQVTTFNLDEYVGLDPKIHAVITIICMIIFLPILILTRKE